MKLAPLLRIWLTRSLKPFDFRPEYDDRLDFMELDRLGIYIHIPFCRSLCSFCPYCKTIYDKEPADRYAEALLHEIQMVGESGEPTNHPRAAGPSPSAVCRTDEEEWPRPESDTAGGGNRAVGLADLESGEKRGLEPSASDSVPAAQNREAQRARKQITSLYFGGGSPALLADQIGRILKEVNKYFLIKEGIGIELHPEDGNVKTLKKLKAAGVTKLSIGVQSFQEEAAAALGRRSPDAGRLSAALREVPFETVSVDLIFAIPGQTTESLKRDVDMAFALGADQIAMYPFIEFSFARGGAKPLKEREKKRMLAEITDYCERKGLKRTSIWTFAREGAAPYSSMTRETFLGFGASAATLLSGQFKINTFDVESYIGRIERGTPPTSLTLRFTRRQRMVYYLFWTAYSMAVSCEDFSRFFGVSLESQYGFELILCRLLGLARKDKNRYLLTDRGAYWFHYMEQFYTLSYIDSMWNLSGKTPFPEELRL